MCSPRPGRTGVCSLATRAPEYKCKCSRSGKPLESFTSSPLRWEHSGCVHTIILYILCAYVSSSVLLAQRDDIDLYIKDAEGYTPFDLYNSTVPGTNPTLSFDDNSPTDLYVWGSNRNATLGLGDDNDRITPEQVLIRRENERRTNVIVERLRPVPIRDISMSRLHTTIVTAEKTSNLRACGFASDGRLGPSSGGVHAQFSLINPQRALSHIVKIASAQDHTLVVNTTGEVLSWGLNRFSQLGYVIEGSIRTLEAQVQISARKITGALRNQVVIGVACCKTASACWTARQLYTWGTNNGQLGNPSPLFSTQLTHHRLRKDSSTSDFASTRPIC